MVTSERIETCRIRQTQSSRHPVAGFTLVELILVLVLVGILSAVAFPRLNLDAFQQYSSELELANALRHAQKVALGSGCEVEVLVDPSGYSLAYTGGGSAACNPGPVAHVSRSGAFQGELSGVSVSGGEVIYDGFGHAAVANLEVSFASGRVVRVEPVTGYVEVL